MQQILIIIGVSILGLLGTIHLLYTYFSNVFDPFDSTLKKQLKKSTLVISKQSSFWDAWIGFNASHSLGPIFVAIIYIPLAIEYQAILFESIWLSALPSVIGLSYFILALRYWFIIPQIGMAIASLCLLLASYLYIF